jgi:hypothetical protein
VEMTIEQQRAIALANARLRLQEQPAEPIHSTMEGMGELVQARAPLSDQLRAAGDNINTMVRTGANSLTFGLADKFAGGMDALTGRAKNYDEGVKAQRAETDRVRADQPGAAIAGDVMGGVAGGAGLIRSGVTLAGRVGPNLFPRVLGYGLEGAAYGGAHGAGSTYSDKASDYLENAKKGAVGGGMIGAGLPVAGTVAGGIYRGGSAFLGPRVEGAGRGASAMLRGAAQADEAGIRGLPQMGPDAMLVDAGPAMLGLGQGAGTGTGQGRTALVNALRGRDAETGPRLAQALDTNLGPAPIPSRVEARLSGDRAYVGQEYESLLNSPQVRAVNTQPLANELDAAAVNLRGPAQRAVVQVRGMLDVHGAPGNLDPHPRALMSTRNAIDGMLATEADPNTIRALTMARQQVDAELARAVPGIKATDARMEELHRQSGGLTQGGKVFDTGKTAVHPADLAADMTQGANPQGLLVGPSAAPMRVRQGARAELDRVVGTKVNDLTALERELATPRDWNSQKAVTLFGQGPTDRVAEALMNNRRFRESYQNIVQNSQTAQRTSAANAMDGSPGGNVPTDTTLTGLGLKALNAVAKALSGASNANTKDEIGRILANQGPEAQRIAQALLASAQSASANSRTLAQVIGSHRWIGATSPDASRK